jgi:hypothetical protein
MYYRCAVATLLFLSIPFAEVYARTVHVIKDQRGPGIIDRGVVVEVFTHAEVERLAEEFLHGEAKGATIARLIISTDSEHLLENYSHGSPRSTFQEAVAEIDRHGMPRGPIARVLSVRGRTKISYLEDGNLSEETPDSVDPAVFEEGAYSYELLHFNINQSRLAGDPWILTAYLKASPSVSIASCTRLYELLRHLTGLADLAIEVRADPWFLDTYRYPLVLEFTRPLNLPNYVRFNSTATVTCNLVNQQITCTGRNFAP